MARSRVEAPSGEVRTTGHQRRLFQPYPVRTGSQGSEELVSSLSSKLRNTHSSLLIAVVKLKSHCRLRWPSWLREPRYRSERLCRIAYLFLDEATQCFPCLMKSRYLLSLPSPIAISSPLLSSGRSLPLRQRVLEVSGLQGRTPSPLLDRIFRLDQGASSRGSGVLHSRVTGDPLRAGVYLPEFCKQASSHDASLLVCGRSHPTDPIPFSTGSHECRKQHRNSATILHVCMSYTTERYAPNHQHPDNWRLVLSHRPERYDQNNQPPDKLETVTARTVLIQYSKKMS